MKKKLVAHISSLFSYIPLPKGAAKPGDPEGRAAEPWGQAAKPEDQAAKPEDQPAKPRGRLARPEQRAAQPRDHATEDPAAEPRERPSKPRVRLAKPGDLFRAHYSRVTGKPEPSGFGFDLYDSIANVPTEQWDSVNAGDDLFLSRAYLGALESAPPETMEFRYAIIRKGEEPVGIAYFQILELNHRVHRPPMRLLRLRNSLFWQVHDTVADTATIRWLVCGNALLSGEHGFSMPGVPKETALHIIGEIAWTIRKSSRRHITVSLVKDFYARNNWPDTLARFGFVEFDAGPNLTIPLRPQWKGFDDYLGLLKPKYRKRANAALRKGVPVRRRQLELAEMIGRRDELFSLYCRVLHQARFRIFILSPDYYIELKRRLGEKFVCDAYFAGDAMIGFTTRIFNGQVLEGYSHGLDYERNREFELYQNFLLDDIKSGISSRSLVINTGRTSAGMKSSLGAGPEPMVCYVRVSGRLTNQMLKPLLHFIKPGSSDCRNAFENRSGFSE